MPTIPKPPAFMPRAVFVTGAITSTALDLPARMQQVYDALKAQGWRIVVHKDVDTEVSLLGTARTRPFEWFMDRPHTVFDASVAQSALDAILKQMDVTYSGLGAWMVEIYDNVVKPTAETIKKGVSAGLPLVAVIVAGLVYLKAK